MSDFMQAVQAFGEYLGVWFAILVGVEAVFVVKRTITGRD